MRVGAAEEGREVVVGGEVAVVDEVLAGVLGVVGPRLRRQPPHQAQHLAVRAQPRVRHRRTPPGARGELLLLIAASLQAKSVKGTTFPRLACLLYPISRPGPFGDSVNS